MDDEFTNTKKRLFILGNGFDLDHGLDTRYQDYYCWLRSASSKRRAKHNIGNISCECVAIDGLKKYWDIECGSKKLERLEENLGELANSDKHEIAEAFKAIVETFEIWSYEVIGERKPYVQQMYDFSEGDVFITFNYTNTLEEIYGIESERICHIHGSGERAVAFRLFGLYGQREGAILGAEKINSDDVFLKRLICKDPEEHLKDHKRELTRLFMDVEEIHVVGSSFSKVDAPYFRKWFQQANGPKPIKIYVHYAEGVESAEKKKQDLANASIDDSLIAIEGNAVLKKRTYKSKMR